MAYTTVVVRWSRILNKSMLHIEGSIVYNITHFDSGSWQSIYKQTRWYAGQKKAQRQNGLAHAVQSSLVYASLFTIVSHWLPPLFWQPNVLDAAIHYEAVRPYVKGAL